MGDHELIEAIDAGDPARVTALIQTGTSPEACNAHGVSALAIAAIEVQADIVRLLLAAGADPNRAFGEDGCPALMVADMSPDCITALLDGGADVNASTSSNHNIINAALCNGDRDKAAPSLRLLLEAGADPTVPNDEALCALDWVEADDRALFLEFGFDPSERPAPRLDRAALWDAATKEATRLGWEIPTYVPISETRYTVEFRFQARVEGWWTEAELAAHDRATGTERERIALEARERRRGRMVRLDVRTGQVLTRW